MHLLNPAALWLLPLAVVPLLLARRQPPRSRIVSTLDLWVDGSRAAAGHASRKRPLDWIVLLQVLFILALTGALARPVLSNRSPAAVLIVDVSASMGARDGQGTRLDEAKGAARQILDALPRGTVVHIVAAGANAIEGVRGTASDDAVRRGLGSLATYAGVSRLADAIGVERERQPGATVFVLSDAPPVASDVRWTRVGHSTDNVAITSLTARRLPYDEHRAEASIGIASFGTRARRVQVTLRGSAVTIGQWNVDLPAGGNRTIVAPLSDPPATLDARLEAPDDGITVDNERVAVVPAARAIRVAFVSPTPHFVEQALATNPNVTLERVASGADVSSFDAVVCTCTAAPSSAAAAIVIPPAGAQGAPEFPITVIDASHPLAAGLDAGDFRAAPATTTASAAEHGTVVARAGTAPLLVADSDGGRRIVTLNLDPRSVSFAVSPALPMVVANAIDWVVGDNAVDVVAGDPLRVALPAAPAAIAATGPSGRPVDVHREGRFAIVDDTSTPGFYTVSSGSFVRRVAVNPAREESDLSMAPGNAPAPRPTIPDAAQAATRELRLLLVLLAAAAVCAEWTVRIRRGLGWFQPARAVVAALLILFAVNAAIPVGRGPLTTMFAIDQSLSVPLRAQRTAAAAVSSMMRGMRADDRSGVVVFGSEPLVERPPSGDRALEDLSVVAPAGATNIESAIDLARAAVPRGGHVVLLSDGRETSGDAMRAANRAATRGVRIDAVPLDMASPAQAVVAATAPPRVHAGEPFRIVVAAIGAPSSRVRAVVDDGGSRSAVDVPIGNDGAGQAVVTERVDRPGVHTYRAILADADSQDLASAPGTAVTVDGTPSLLYVTANSSPALPQLAGFTVTRLTPTALPRDGHALAPYDAVILDDVPTPAIDPAAASALASYVTNDGGGLLVTGTASTLASLPPDGALGALLPVNFRAKSTRRGASVAYVLIVDKSGSMSDKVSGISKMELARESAARLVGALPDDAALGVVAFDGTPLSVMPLAPIEHSGDLVTRLRAIEPGGSTRIAPAVQMAASWLAASGAPKRRALLISDGRSTADDASRLRALAATRAFELSVVAIGSDADRELLGAVARETGGRAYFPDDLRSLPQIVAGDAADAAGRAVVQEHFTLRAPAPHPILGGIAAASLPAMDGYVVSTLRPGGEMVLASHLDDPVLAAGRAGLGHVAVFTSDLRSTWTTAMRRWPQDSQLWNQAVHWTSRRTEEGALEAQVLETDTGARLVVDGIRADGTSIGLDQARATVRATGSGTISAPLVATAPGRYEADVPLSDVGTCEIVVEGRDTTTGADLRLMRASYWSGGRERLTAGADRALLAQIAAVTGGHVLAAGDTPFAAPRPLAYRSIAAAAGVLALLVYLLDLAGLRRHRRSRPQSTSPSRAAA